MRAGDSAITSGPVAGAGGAPFYDRTDELGALLAARAAAGEGRGSIVLLSGEAGIGKTALSRVFLDRSRADGAIAAWGTGWEAGGAPPYWVWIQALRGLAERLGPQALAAALPGGPGPLTRLLPELGGDIDPSELRGDEARFALFDTVVRLLRALGAANPPLVLVLDDLHAADPDALLMLELAGRSIPDAPVLLLGTVREEATTSGEAREALARIQGAARTVRLGGLPAGDVASLAAHVAGTADGPLVRRLHERTGGNPLFLNESLRLMDAQGSDVADVHLPRGLRETIGRRIDGLPGEVGALLEVAAAIGREVRLETLAAVDGRSGAELLAVLDVTAAHAVLRPVHRRPGRWRFTHGLLREAIHDGLPALRRAELHRDIALALENIDGDAAEPAELAYHWMEAVPAGEAARAVEATSRAGAAARRALAWDRAEAWFADALCALDVLPADTTRRCGVLLDLGDAQMHAGRTEQARETLEAAADLAAAAGDRDALARAALTCTPWGLALTVDDTRLEILLTRALAAEPDDPAVRARLRSALAGVRYWSMPIEDRLELIDEAIEIARMTGDPATLARVLADAHLATWDPDSLERSPAWAAEIEALGEAAIGPELVLYAATWRISLLLEAGEIAGAERAIGEFAGRARALQQPRARRAALRHEILRLILDGHFDDAERAMARAGEAGEAREGSTDALLMAGQAFVLRWYQGRLGELEPIIRGLADHVAALPVWRCALIAALVQMGHAEDVRVEFDRLAGDGFAALPYDNQYLVSLALLTDAAEFLQDRAAAAALVARLRPFSGRWVVSADAAVFGPVDRFLGRAQRVAGEHGAADASLDRARSSAALAGAAPVLAQLDADRGTPGMTSPDGPGTGRGAETSSDPGLARLRHAGDVWHVTWSGTTCVVRDVRGLHYLARLLASPDTEIHALELTGTDGGRNGDAAAATAAGLEVRPGADGDLGPVLDEAAKAAYRERLRELDHDLDEAEAHHDDERAGMLRDERDALVHELSAAVGLGGRDRRPGSSAERARVNVTRAIRSAIERIGGHHRALGRHLDVSVRTGTFCSYRPEPDTPGWVVED